MFTILNADSSIAYPCLISDVHPTDPDSGWAWEEGQSYIEIPFQPDPAQHVWNGTTWILSLQFAQDRKWEEAKAYRDQRQTAGCNTPKGRMDTDTESWVKLNGAVTMSQLLGDAFSVDWTMADNTVVTHNAAEIQAAGLAVGQFIAVCHSVGESLRSQIYGAVTVDAVNAIDIEGAAWPT